MERPGAPTHLHAAISLKSWARRRRNIPDSTAPAGGVDGMFSIPASMNLVKTNAELNGRDLDETDDVSALGTGTREINSHTRF